MFLYRQLINNNECLFIDYYKECFPNDKLFNYIINSNYVKNNKTIKNITLSTTYDLPNRVIGQYWPLENSIVILKGQELNTSLLLHEFGHGLLNHNINLHLFCHKLYVSEKVKFDLNTLNKYYGFLNEEEFFCELISNLVFYSLIARNNIVGTDSLYWSPYADLFPKWFTPNNLFYKLDKHLK